MRLVLPTVLVNGVHRRALMCVPEYAVKRLDATHNQTWVKDAITPVVIPDDVEVESRPWWLVLTGAMFPHTMFLRTPDVIAYPVKTIVHELVHKYTIQWMGPLVYFATFGWQFVLAVARHGVKWHDHHLMEREANRVSNLIAARVTRENATTPLDAPALIAELLPRAANKTRFH